MNINDAVISLKNYYRYDLYQDNKNKIDFIEYETIKNLWDIYKKIDNDDNSKDNLLKSIKNLVNNILPKNSKINSLLICEKLGEDFTNEILNVNDCVDTLSENDFSIKSFYMYLIKINPNLLSNYVDDLIKIKNKGELIEDDLNFLNNIVFDYLNDEEFKVLDKKYEKTSKVLLNIFNKIMIDNLKNNNKYQKLIKNNEKIKQIKEKDFDNEEFISSYGNKFLIEEKIDSFFDQTSAYYLNQKKSGEVNIEQKDINIIYFYMKNKNTEIEKLFKTSLNIDFIMEYINTNLINSELYKKSISNLIQGKFTEENVLDINNLIINTILKNGDYNNFINYYLLIKDKESIEEKFNKYPELKNALNIKEFIKLIKYEDVKTYQQKLSNIIDSENNELLSKFLFNELYVCFNYKDDFFNRNLLERFNLKYESLTEKEKADFIKYSENNLFIINSNEVSNYININFDELKYFLNFYIDENNKKNKIPLEVNNDLLTYRKEKILHNKTKINYDNFKVILKIIHKGLKIDLNLENFIEKEILRIETFNKNRVSENTVFKL